MPLSPSERVTLIKEICTRLGQEEWALLDLTLKQFGLPTNDEWGSPDKGGYTIEMIGKAADGVLVDLAKHVGYETKIGPHSVEPAFWVKSRLRMFLSHLAAHRALAAELQQALYPLGISCFVAHNDIVPTEEWQTQIEVALSTCDLLVALLHPEFHKSSWTDQEIGFAMGRGIPVFAVRIGQDPYGFIGRFQAFNGLGKPIPTLAKELLVACLKHKQTQTTIAGALVSRFEESESFANAKERIKYLEDLETWEQSFSDRITAAAEANGQISGSFGVPQRVKALVKKWST